MNNFSWSDPTSMFACFRGDYAIL